MKKTIGKPKAEANENNRGIALITVLAILSLAAVLILAFFSITQNELTSSTKYSQGLEAQQLSQTAVNIVMHQIRSATDTAGVAWASQPGMVRTWSSAGFRGFKLYSDDHMVLNDKSEVDVDELEMRQWDSEANLAIYTDLNEPVIRGDRVFYPIVDPRAWQEGARTGGKPKSQWTVSNPGAASEATHVEGFYYSTEDVKASRYGTAGTGDQQHKVGLPMPVKWLYQLEDGSMGYLDEASKEFKLVSGVGIPSKENPMQARIAFWADDESTKVNINTAAGGRPWDIPRAGGTVDRDYGSSQPVQREWQRYPGHPATVSLLPILYPNQAMLNLMNYGAREMEYIYTIVPRIRDGGSMNGNVKVRFPPTIERDNDRLYATIDELMFQAPALEPSMVEKSLNKGMHETRQLNAFPALKGRKVDPEYLSQLQFFLTANSVAPETTVFNTPRISMWPSHYGDPSKGNDRVYYTAFDERIRFCAEVGGAGGKSQDFPSGKFIYHFQRENSESRTHDYENIQRNQDLYSYLQWLTEQPIPGVGKSMESKYSGAEVDQIITEIFDYIRCTNLFDDTLYEGPNAHLVPSSQEYGTTSWPDNPNDHIAYTNTRVDYWGANLPGQKQNPKVSRSQHTGHGQVAPIEIGDTKGFGRFYGIMETGIVFICCAEGAMKPDGTPLVGGVGSYDRYRIVGKEWLPYEGDPGRQHDLDENTHWSNIAPLDFTPSPDLQAASDGHIAQAEGIYGQVPGYFKQTKDKMAGGGGLDADDQVRIREWTLLATRANWNYMLAVGEPMKPNEKRVQAMLMFQAFCPSQGWTALNPDFRLEVNLNGDWSLESVSGGGSKDLELPKNGKLRSPHNGPEEIWHGRPHGGLLEPRYFTVGTGENLPGSQEKRGYFLRNRYAGWEGGGNGTSPKMLDNKGAGNPVNDPLAMEYPWVSAPVTIAKANPTQVTAGGRIVNGGIDHMKFSGGSMDIRLYPGDGYGSDSDNPNSGADDYSQAVVIEMEGTELPMPGLVSSTRGRYENQEYRKRHRGDPIPNTEHPAPGYWTFHRDGAFKDAGGSIQRVGGRLNAGIGHIHGRKLSGTGDVTRSYVVAHGDYRLPMAKRTATVDFEPQAKYFEKDVAVASNFYHSNNAVGYGSPPPPPLVDGMNYAGSKKPFLPENYRDHPKRNFWGDFDNTQAAEQDGSFINKPDEGNSRGIGTNDYVPPHWGKRKPVAREYIPYFSEPWSHEAAGAGFFSPNRIMPSPGMIGSLPTGVKSDTPWQTILLRPQHDSIISGAPNAGKHRGMEDPKDHYLLDYFWMPVVEPWSISTPLATAGKININYDMQPFGHIQRSTGIRCVFPSEEMLTIPKVHQVDYTTGYGYGNGYDHFTNTDGTLRYKALRSLINAEETLKQFDEKFDANDLFVTASQICEMHLVPVGIHLLQKDIRPKLEDLRDDKTFWTGNPKNPKHGLGLVGDNSRERPYANIYQRITTKSNTYQVHYRSQVVRQSPMSPSNPNQRRSDAEYATFDPSMDKVVSEYRGSTIIERYIDPNDERIPDYATNPPDVGGSGGSEALDRYYRFRIVSNKRFAP